MYDYKKCKPESHDEIIPCPLCKSRNITDISTYKNYGIFGSGRMSHKTSDLRQCDDCCAQFSRFGFYYVTSYYSVDSYTRKDFTNIIEAREHFEEVKFKDFGCRLVHVRPGGTEEEIEKFINY